MHRFSFLRYVIAFFLLPIKLSMAAFPVDEEVSFTGGGTNLTFNSDWVGEFRMSIDDSNNVIGYLDADGLPGGQIICGMGDFSGYRVGDEINVEFVSNDIDEGCGFDHGDVNTFTGNFSDNESVFSGEYIISNGQRGVFSFTTEESQNKWGDLETLENNYLSLRESGSNEAAFAHQFSCIAQTSCAVFERGGSSDWSNGFVKHLFDSMENRNGLSSSLETGCPSMISSTACFLLKGVVHAKELVTGFSSYCSDELEISDYEEWDKNHNLFLSEAVLSCFIDVVTADELPRSTLSDVQILSIIGGASILRENSQTLCGGLRIFGGNNNKRVISMVDMNQLAENLFSLEMSQEGGLVISARSSEFFVDVGSELQLQIQKKMQDGSMEDISSSDDNVYQVLTAIDSVDISQNGIVTVNRYANPQSEINRTNLLYILVQNGQDYGIGQFAVIDEDTDEDGLVDSYEDINGLNANRADALDRDSDNDTLTNHFEARLGTHPSRKDTDGDRFSDGFEYHTDSEPLDPDCNPIDGCTEETPVVEPEEPIDPQPTTDTLTGAENPDTQDDPSTVTEATDSNGGGAMVWLTYALFLLLIVRRCHGRRKS